MISEQQAILEARKYLEKWPKMTFDFHSISFFPASVKPHPYNAMGDTWTVRFRHVIPNGYEPDLIIVQINPITGEIVEEPSRRGHVGGETGT